jgi:hypothetical protein
MKRRARRDALHVLTLLLAPAAALADDTSGGGEFPFTPPPYQVLRFNENYLYLSNPTNRSDWFDPIKYIPLRSPDPFWYLTIGGELRERFEGNYDANLGIGGVGSDSYLLQRITLLTDLHLGERVRLFAEGISGLIEGESLPAPPVQQDPIDLAYAFLDVVPYLNYDQSFTLRAGRFGMHLGSGRLVATRAAAGAPNIPFRFEGFEALYSTPLWAATAFLTQPVEDAGGISGADHSTTFWGLYVTHWFDAPHLQGLDFYYLGDHIQEATYASGTADEHRQSFGMRFFGVRDQWDWNQEDVIQVGSFGSDSILAWTASLDAGYTWQTTLNPRLGLKVNVISGDADANNGRQGTFNALYPNPGYFNDASLFRPANFIDVHPNIQVNLAPNISVNGGIDLFWRYSRNDAVYSVSGSILVPALSNEPAYVATAVDVNLQWQIQRHVTFLASYVHFFTGDYIHAAGGEDMNFVSATISFVF